MLNILKKLPLIVIVKHLYLLLCLFVLIYINLNPSVANRKMYGLLCDLQAEPKFPLQQPLIFEFL